jgi:hypothetical protein
MAAIAYLTGCGYSFIAAQRLVLSGIFAIILS